MKKLPEKFEICTKYDRTSRYQLTLGKDTGKYHLQNVTSLEDAYNEPISYSGKFVQDAIDCGNWIITGKFGGVAAEPELVLPFCAIYQGEPDLTFTVSEGTEADSVTISGEGYDGAPFKLTYKQSDVKSFIKKGIWIVKHVGEKPQEPTVTISYAPVADGEKFYLKCSSVGDESISVAAPQAPQSAPLSNLSLTLTADTDAAVGAVERLRQALEDLAISYESVIALQREFKESV